MNTARTNLAGSALFVGHGYIDIELVVEKVPIGDEKVLASQAAVSFGGNAVTAAFCCARLGFVPDLLSSSAEDPFGRMFTDMVAKYGLHWHQRRVNTFSFSAIFPNNGKRAMGRWRDEDYLHGFPQLNLEGCRAVHVDGLMGDAALHYVKEARQRGILTSLDGGSMRDGLEELLTYIDVAVVSVRLCEQMNLTPDAMLDYLRGKGCKVGGVTLGEHGMRWYEDSSQQNRTLPALHVPPERVADTNGAGDIFHGAYLYSYLTWPNMTWEDHFKFARAASAHAVQHLGNEASLPSEDDISRTMDEFSEHPCVRVA